MSKLWMDKLMIVRINGWMNVLQKKRRKNGQMAGCI